MAKRNRRRSNRPSQSYAPPPVPMDEPQISENQEPGRIRVALSGWAMIIGWIAMLIFTFHACTRMVAAGDTWVAMACGRHFVNHGVDTIEPFSANSHKPGPTAEEIEKWPGWARWITDKVGIETVKKWHPTGWVNQNWLTHVIFYLLVPKSSYADGVSFSSNALVYWKFAVYIITVACVFYTGVLMGVNPALSAVFSCFALFIGRSFLDIRPAGFSNMLVGVFLLVLVLATYRNVLYIWLIVPLTVFWCNAHGGYIYVYIMMIPFIGLHLLNCFDRKVTAILYNIGAWPLVLIVLTKATFTLAAFLFVVLVITLDILLVFYKDKLVTIRPKGVYHIIGAYVATIIATIIFNPFHFTNLTHTFVISVSKHAERWRDIHEWHPAFEWTNPVGTAVPFAVMYGIAWAVLVIWILTMIITSGSVGKYAKRKASDTSEYQWPKLDLPMLLIAALTIYMAIRSRRFIPIGAIAACPILALLIDQIVRAIAATDNFHRHKRLAVPVMPKEVKILCILAGAIATIFFGTWWGTKFKHVYLDPWPNDPKLTSVFMRMTASDAKPFYATKFMKLNHLKGKMFNYWTEGGAIAFGQEPDPNTGKTPLQLFMDGRAQAAYDRKTFDLWTAITSGGPTVQAAAREAMALGKPLDAVLTTADYKKVGEWLTVELRKQDVWVVLMPAGQFDQPFTRGLEYSRDWPVVFSNNKEKMFVDINTPQGAELFEGISTGRTLYPDEYHRNLILGHHLLNQRSTKDRQTGFDLMTKAFNENPSPAPMLEFMLVAARSPDLTSQVTKVLSGWVEKFAADQDEFRRRNGYRLRIEAARLACIHLERTAAAAKDNELAESYNSRMRDYLRERNELSRTKRW
ncbi:MAG: hypothetical protein JXN61_13545 [Sedimentisphaerales bacterium]|nr:hypothetical protein [Sedimentisphaerales bacterium]